MRLRCSATVARQRLARWLGLVIPLEQMEDQYLEAAAPADAALIFIRLSSSSAMFSTSSAARRPARRCATCSSSQAT